MPWVGTVPDGLRHSKEASVAGTESVRYVESGEEVRGKLEDYAGLCKPV